MYPALLIRSDDRSLAYSENVTGADNQQERLDGHIKRNGRRDRVLVFVVRRRARISRNSPTIVGAMALGRHRKVRWQELLSRPESSETVRQTKLSRL